MVKMTRTTLAEVVANPRPFDRAKVEATTEEDIRRYMIEDGQDPDAPEGEWVDVYPPRMVREGLGLSQEAFAAALRVPVGTIRNWEQGRTRPDPAAQSLLTLVGKLGPRALEALRARAA